ncbi:MAG: hypothetical protein BAA04_13795 [Firmicutes bacterium ZCTH02-B6]|nr:MAG: hypothetical protein BAA04_13795 [Firmicutes bacterium ZCTH02-B6]
MTVIHGENIVLRPIREEDYPLLVKWGRDPELARLLEGDYPQSLVECLAWHQRVASDRHRQLWGIELDGVGLIGDVELDHIAWRSGDAELRIRIGERQHWDQGYGTEAVTLLLAHAFGPMNLQRVYLRVFSFNERAIRCYRKAGFRREGVLVRRAADGERRQVFLMRILREEFLRIPRREAAAG